MVIVEERLLKKQRHAQKWLRLSELPSERFTEGLLAALGGVVLELVAENRLAALGGKPLSAMLDAAAAKFTREYVEQNGSVYR